jgi:hypothetical protein
LIETNEIFKKQTKLMKYSRSRLVENPNRMAFQGKNAHSFLESGPITAKVDSIFLL